MQRQRKCTKDKPWIRKVDYVFYHEQEIRETVYEARNTGSGSVIPSVMRNASGISDPTAHEALYNLTPLPSVMIDGQRLLLPERWLTVIDKTYAWCSRQSEKIHLQVLKRRYNSEDYKKTCSDLHISQAYFYKIIESAKMYAALQAVQLGLIFVE